MQRPDKKTSFKIDKKIYIVFFVLIIIAITNAIVSTFTIEKSKKITTEIGTVTNPSLSQLFEMNQLVTKSRMYITNWVYLQNNKNDRESLARLNQQTYPEVKTKLLQLVKLWDNKATTDSLKKVLDDYEQLVHYENQIMHDLVSFDDYQDPMKKFAAEDLIETQIIPRSYTIARLLSKITEQKKTEACIKQDKMIYSFSMLTVVVLGLALLIILSVITITFFMSKNIILPVMQIRELILQMSKGELPHLNMKMPKNAVGEMGMALRALMDGLRRTSSFAKEIGTGNFSYHFEPLSENDVQGKALIEMRDQLKEVNESDTLRNWTTEGIALLGNILHKNSDNLEELTNEIVNAIVNYIGVQQAAIFLVDKENTQETNIQLNAYYAISNKMLQAKKYELKEGLVGQCVNSNKKIYINNLESPYFTIESGLGKSSTCCVAIIPLYAAGNVLGAIEIASLYELSQVKMDFLERIAEPVSLSIFSVKANLLTKKLLEESMKQADALTAQKQDLRWANEELTNKSKLLELSQEELKSQQDELKQMNAELEMKAHLLQEQNLAIEEARQSLSFKAQQLEESNKYKSAFLANMSHELRTPLNSVLILAKLLAENKSQNLSEKQIEHASVIYKSGNDLLMLINDILDLSKIEAGKIELHNEQFNIQEIASDLQSLFKELANEKGINFSINIAKDIPAEILSDKMRLSQILKNLLSNAFKFTPKAGKVMLNINLAPRDAIFKNQKLYQTDKVISFSVSDTGIGIPEDKQKIIFEAFQQADGSTSRKFGGTGLGLAISRELSTLLGGDLVLHSIENSGSTFTIHLPHSSSTNEQLLTSTTSFPNEISEEQYPPKNNGSIHFKNNEILDDRNNIKDGDKKILIVEDDILFAKTLIDCSHEYTCKAVVAVQGDVAIDYAKQFHPDIIILDMQLPVVDGWTILKQLKENADLKHIPVYVISAMDKKALGLQMGAAGYLTKPASREDINKIFFSVAQCAYVDAYVVTKAVMNNKNTDHKTAAPTVSQSFTPAISSAESHKNILNGKTVLLADDDMRNIYSIATILEGEGLNVICAYDGLEATKKLIQNKSVEIVLMDIMMPNMNGYEAITQIRNEEKYKQIPIIAITAKAMQGDREKCIDAGASDFITKPVNIEQLISVMKAWMYK